MMRVLDVFQIKGRGTVACVESDGACPKNGSVVRRVSDGQMWSIEGVERFGLFIGTVGRAGEKIGLLLGGNDQAARIGDELERSPT